MRYLLIVLLLFIGCDDDPASPQIEGCTDESACNYDDTATTEDESCSFSEENHDCDGNCTTETDVGCDCGVLADNCLVCGGDNSSCTETLGCMDIEACNYSPDATINSNSFCLYVDCLGECGGFAALIDQCGVCGGDGSTCNTTIRGYVYDSSGNPIENAYIFLGYEIINITRPSTTIAFSMANLGNVNMWVENECDEIISTIIDNELLEAGYHQETWNAISSEGLTLLDGVYEVHLSIDDYLSSFSLVLLKFASENSALEGEFAGYDNGLCFDADGQLICEYLALTNSSGFFEFTQDCISLNHEWTEMDEVGNELGSQGLGRIRLFADDGQNHGTSNYFEVDLFNGAETNIIIGE